MLKKILIAFVLMCAGFAAHADQTTDIQPNGNLSGGNTAANCTQPVLGTYSGSTNFEAKWRANTVPLRWYNEGNRITTVQDAAKTCTYDGALNIPSAAPSRTGYTFAGWKVIPGLPAGYTELEYIEASGTQYIDTGIKLANTDIVESVFKNATSTDFGALYGVYQIGESSAFYANQTYYAYDGENNKINTNVTVNTNWHSVIHNFVNGSLTIDNTKTTFPAFTFTNTVNNALFTRYYNGSYGYYFKGAVKRYKITRNGAVILNFIPAKNSSNVIGMYDTVSGTFFTNSGSGTFTAGPALD